MNKIFDTTVFYVEQHDQGDNLEDITYATHVKCNSSMRRIEWRCGERGRVIDYSKKDDLKVTFPSEIGEGAPLIPSRITIVDSRNHCKYILEPMTLEKYNELVRPRISGHPEFENDKEMVDFFCNL